MPRPLRANLESGRPGRRWGGQTRRVGGERWAEGHAGDQGTLPPRGPSAAAFPGPRLSWERCWARPAARCPPAPFSVVETGRVLFPPSVPGTALCALGVWPPCCEWPPLSLLGVDS